MGTTFRLIFYTHSDSLANKVSKAAFTKAENLNIILSDYLEKSELNQLSRNAPHKSWIPISPELYTVLKKSGEISEITDGAFDVTVGPYVQRWRQLRREYNPELPSADTLQQISKFVGFNFLKIHPSKHAVKLTQPNMQLDLGGIAKGYATDKMLQLINSYGIYSVLIDAGGDIRIGNPPPGKSGWDIAINSHTPDGTLQPLHLIIANKAIATSGDLYQHIEIDGRRYSHIIDPKTGIGLTHQRTVTVIASDGITADGYASAISVMNLKEAMPLLSSSFAWAFVEYQINKKAQCKASPDFKKFLKVPNTYSCSSL